MRKVYDSTKSNSGSRSTGESTDIRDDSEEFANIKLANKKVRTIDILRGYGFKIEKNYQRPNWSNNIICPLPNHKGAKERTPSFGYCFVSDHFHCFGCGSTGRAVEFISLYEKCSRYLVADKILSQYGEMSSFEDDNDYEDDLSPILLDGSKYLQILVQKYKSDPKKLKEIDKVMWWLDFYLLNKVPGNNVLPEELKKRIERMKDLL